MAIVESNFLTHGLSGLFGDVVFRQLRGKTYVSPRPASPKTQSEAQRNNRSKFKDASVYAKACMLIPEKKAYYAQKAKKLKLPNAYTAAITDYMRKGTIEEVETPKTNGKKPENRIRVFTRKPNFEMHQVHVSVVDEQGTILHTGAARKFDRDVFDFSLPDNLNAVPGMMLTIHASGVGGDVISHTTAFG